MSARVRRALAILSLSLTACAERDLTGSFDQVVEGERPFDYGEQYAYCEQGNDCLDEWCLSPAGEAGFCTQACDPEGEVSDFCVDAPNGTATAVCLRVGGDAACALDCGEGRGCPSGMRCEQVEAQGAERWICF
ncbi:MAG: hypothetical protein KC431_01345 [Myxococcales bacterium]|nr:hypothetical protein [Myxococcales bacterium]MCA9696137.1 hypothetical protein [Myxococcales bacterium]